MTEIKIGNYYKVNNPNNKDKDIPINNSIIHIFNKLLDKNIKEKIGFNREIEVYRYIIIEGEEGIDHNIEEEIYDDYKEYNNTFSINSAFHTQSLELIKNYKIYKADKVYSHIPELNNLIKESIKLANL